MQGSRGTWGPKSTSLCILAIAEATLDRIAKQLNPGQFNSWFFESYACKELLEGMVIKGTEVTVPEKMVDTPRFLDLRFGLYSPNHLG